MKTEEAEAAAEDEVWTADAIKEIYKSLFDNKMNAEEEAVAADIIMCCASCGQAEIDDIKLKKCACNLVKYCSDNCMANHRPDHEEECKKGLDKLRERELFEQPDSSHYGECPICCLPLSLDPLKSTMSGCCSNMICNGCNYANQKRENEAGLKRRCAFCRELVPESEEEYDKNVMERIKKNDPVALREEGIRDCNVGDYKTAIKYLTKAAELGDAIAHFELSGLYLNGEGVNKDAEKEYYHLEQAAIGGHPIARHNLGCMEAEIAGWSGRYERAKKHWIIAANLGFEDSLKNVKDLYAHGDASKEDYFNALRAYQAAVDATKSSERERAEQAMKNGEVRNLF